MFLLKGNFFNAPCIDEVAHLPAAVSHWQFENFDLYRVNPPLARLLSGLPIINPQQYDWTLHKEDVGQRPEFAIGYDRLRKVKLRISDDFLLPRVAASGFLLIGLTAIASWAPVSLRWRYALLVCLFWASCPNMLAFAPTVLPDLGSAAMGVIAGYASWRYVHSPGTGTSLFAGLALGLALLTKLTWLTAVFSLPLTVAVCVLTMGKHLPWRSVKARTADLTIFWISAMFILNAGYLFEGTFQPLGEYEFCSEMLGGEGCSVSKHGNRFHDNWLASMPVPVPRNYLLGIDYLKYEVETKMWSFLLGEWKYGSWWYYYILTVLFKTPEPTLVAAFVGLGLLIVGIRRKLVGPQVISMFLFLGIPAIVCFASVSLQGGFNHHHRYVLMVYPFVFALAGYVASPVAVKLLRFRLPFSKRSRISIATPLALVLVSLSMTSSLRVHPYYTSYFNSLSGGPENGWRLLGYSNIDWGQDLLEVEKWLKKYPQKRPLSMDLNSLDMSVDLFDVSASKPPELPELTSIDEVRMSIDETQWWIISVKKLHNRPGFNGLEYLQQIEPVEKIAYAYHVYRIDPLSHAGGVEGD